MANEFKLPTNPFKFGSIEYDNWNYEHPEAQGGTDAALSAAKGSLARANEFADQTGSADIATLDERLAGLRSKPDTRGIVRRITEPLSTAGNASLAASLAALPASALNPAFSTTLGAAGGLLVAPDIARRYFMPEAGEEAPGNVELGLTAVGAAPGVRGLKTLLGKAAPFIGPLGDLEGAAGIGGRALAYEGPQVTANGARPALLGSQKVAAEKLLESPSFAGLPRDVVAPQGAQSFADAVRAAGAIIKGHMGTEQGAQTFADAVRERAASPFFKMNAEGAFGGDRTVRGIGALEKEGKGGLSSLVPHSRLAIPSVQDMDPMERLAARSVERFGKRYRQ